MSHPCKTTFWGDAAQLLLTWCDFLDEVGQQSGRTTTQPTWQALCLVKSQIERATQCLPTDAPPWIGGGGFDPATEDDLRALANVFVSLLAADEWDNLQPNPHTGGSPGWIRTPPPPPPPPVNPQPGSLTVLIGGNFPPGAPATPGSLLGRIRSSLGC